VTPDEPVGPVLPVGPVRPVGPPSTEIPTYGNTRLLAIPRQTVENIFDPNPVQLFPLVEYASVFELPIPPITHHDPFQATPLPQVARGFVVASLQLLPFVEYLIDPPIPPATHIDPFQATLRPKVEKEPEDAPLQLLPLLEYAIVLVPDPTATHNEPFQAIA
jgi:hypothetical protein